MLLLAGWVIGGAGVRVVIVGAGMGGLGLAQALVADDHEVTVLERDPCARATGGYRLHLDAAACEVLRDVLPADVWAAVQASGAGRSAFRQLALTDARLRVLAVERQDPAEEVLMIGRVPLRALLAHGLQEQIRWGTCAVAVSDEGDSASVLLDDGSRVRADLVVGADGARSTVAAALAGTALVRPVGAAGIAGRTPLDEHTRALLPGLLADGPLLAFSATGVVVFLTVHDPERGAVLDPRPARPVRPVVEPPALVWGVNAVETTLPGGARGRDGRALLDVALGLLRGWDAGVRRLVEAAEVRSVAGYSFYAPVAGADLMPWPAGRLAALGDAVHAVPPTGGQGASAAIRDAGHLAARLREVSQGRAALGTALAAFQRDVARYAPGVVVESLQPLRWARTVSRPGVRQCAQVVLPALATFTHAWHHRPARGRRVA